MSDPMACLPSGNAAIRLWRGGPYWPQNAFMVLSTALLRGSLIAGGLAIAGARGKDLVKYTIAGTGAIEAFVLLWAGYQVAKESRTETNLQ